MRSDFARKYAAFSGTKSDAVNAKTKFVLSFTIHLQFGWNFLSRNFAKILVVYVLTWARGFAIITITLALCGAFVLCN